MPVLAGARALDDRDVGVAHLIFDLGLEAAGLFGRDHVEDRSPGDPGGGPEQDARVAVLTHHLGVDLIGMHTELTGDVEAKS